MESADMLRNNGRIRVLKEEFTVVEMSAERHDNGLGLGSVIIVHGGKDGIMIE
jgi:hypothetical protein